MFAIVVMLDIMWMAPMPALNAKIPSVLLAQDQAQAFAQLVILVIISPTVNAQLAVIPIVKLVLDLEQASAQNASPVISLTMANAPNVMTMDVVFVLVLDTINAKAACQIGTWIALKLFVSLVMLATTQLLAPLLPPTAKVILLDGLFYNQISSM